MENIQQLRKSGFPTAEIEGNRTIDKFEGEYAFLTMKAPADISIDGYSYLNITSALKDTL